MSEATEDGEVCVRCGERGEDRRTLWHACFYAMDELKLPFEQRTLFYADIDKLKKAKEPGTVDLKNGQKLTLIPGTVTTDGELTPHNFFTLRVCKDCRASWMEAIQRWFHSPADADDGKREVGSGIFVRKNGTNVEITEEEWHRLQAEKERTT